MTPCFKNSWKNFWNRGRKGALLQTQAALDTLKGKDGKFTLEKLEYSTGLFNEALNNKGLSQETRNALKALVNELKAETGIYFKTTYSEKQLKTMFASVKQHEENLLGEGSYGKVYTNDDGRLAFKIINSEEPFEADVHGNKAFGKGAENFTKNKEFFYRQSEGFVTEYIGAFEQDRQKIVVFERIKGKDFGKHIEEKRKIEQQQPLNTASAEKQLRKDCIILSQMATAVAAVHESGCINRDIKPQNTMLSVRTTAEPERDEAGNVIRNDNGEIQMKQTEVPYAKLIDQGTVIDLKEGKPLTEIDMAGSPSYIPQEAIAMKVIPSTDVYALGVSVMEAVCPNIEDFRNLPDADTQTYFGTNVPNAIKQCFGDKMPFLRDLVLKCCSFNPEDRPSAAQIAYCLEVYTSVIGTEAEKSLKFDEVLKMAEADRPKGIPLALREMMQSEDNAVRQKGCTAVLNLGDADPSYKKTPSYGLALLRTEPKKFETWASDNENKKVLQDLKNRIYTGKKPQTTGGVWSEKDIKVSQNEFDAINNLFPKKNPDLKNLV